MINRPDLQSYARVVKLIAEASATVDNMTQAQNVAALPGDTLGNYADYCYALKQIEELADKLRKEAKNKGRAMQATACALFIQLQPEEPVAHGKYASAKPNFKQAINTLKRTEETAEAYDAFCREALGVTNESAIAAGVINVHFDSFQEWHAAALAEGKNYPSLELFKPFNMFSYDTRKKPGVNLLED